MPRRRLANQGGTDITWNSWEVLSDVERRLAQRLERAGFMYVKQIKKSLSTGQDFRWSVPRTPGGVPRMVGLDPAGYREPPHLLTGALRNSVKSRVLKRGKILALQVGAFTAYARRLEFEGHPYIRPAIRKHRAKANRIVFPGKKTPRGRKR